MNDRRMDEWMIGGINRCIDENIRKRDGNLIIKRSGKMERKYYFDSSF